MMDLAGKSIIEIASDSRVQQAVNRINRLREAEKIASDALVRLSLAEHDLRKIQLEIEASK